MAVVIVIQATKSETKPAGPTTAIAATSTVAEELWWVGSMFLKVSASVAFWRALSRMWSWSPVAKQAYDRADDLVSFVERKPPFGKPDPLRPGSSRSSSTSSSPESGFASASAKTAQSGKPISPAPPFEPSRPGEKARFAGKAGEFPILHHAEKLNPEHLWPCPMQLRDLACADCNWLVEYRGKLHCVAVEKLKFLLRGEDDGVDLYEMRAWLKEEGNGG
jgi:hypothetical protein